MKSCLGILLVFFTFVTVIGGGALIWYLSNTAEFSRKDAATASSSSPAAPPRATIPNGGKPLKATPVPAPAIPKVAPKPTPKQAPQPSSPFGSKEPPKN